MINFQIFAGGFFPGEIDRKNDVSQVVPSVLVVVENFDGISHNVNKVTRAVIFKSPAVIPLSSTEERYSRKKRLVSFSTSARFTCTLFVSFISSFKEATIFFKCSFSRRIALSVTFSSASFMEYLLTNQHSPVKNFHPVKG